MARRSARRRDLRRKRWVRLALAMYDRLKAMRAWAISSKGPVALRPSSGCRDDLDDRGLQFLGGGERPIVLKFTGAAIDLDRIESRPCCRQLVAKSVEQCVFRSPIVRKNHAVPSTHNRVREQS